MTESCSCPPEAGNATCDLHGSVSGSSCPVCLKTGKLIDSITLKALLSVPLTQIRHVDYRFCRTLDCPVIYYTQDGTQTFRENDLRERVFQKHVAADDVFVCYCFRHTTGSIKEKFANHQTDSVIASITAGIQAGQCACDIRNPQGSCCLGNVRQFIHSLEDIHS